MEEITNFLMANQDTKYKDFNATITPVQNMIGVRTPVLRDYAKRLTKENPQLVKDFMAGCPHTYFEENQLHAFLIALIKDYDACIDEIEKFLPYVDNWATCDQMNPKILGRNKEDLLRRIKIWIRSDKTYTIRFGIKMLMDSYLGESFDIKYMEMVCKVKSDEYYVKMVQAWYVATALATNYDEAIGFIENKKLSSWTHNKAIQKAIESFRVTDEHKKYLKTLKIK